MNQQSLLPMEAVKGEQAEVEIALLPSEFLGRRASAGMTESIARFGVIQPVLLIRSGEGYKVADGRNRIINARAAGLTTVPALIFPEGYSPTQVLALVANALRSDNVLTDLTALEELAIQGASMEAILSATGLNKATVEKRLKLLGLIPALRAGLEAGKLAATTAERAAVLPVAEQEELARLLTENGKVKGKDVATVRTVVCQGAIEGLPDDLFNTPALPFSTVPTAPQETPELSYQEQLAKRGADAMAVLWKLAKHWHKQGGLSLENDADLWAEVSAFYGDEFKEDKVDGRAKGKSKRQKSSTKS